MPPLVVLCFMRETERLRSGISALWLNQSAVFGKSTSSFNTSANYRGEHWHTSPDPECMHRYPWVTGLGLASLHPNKLSWSHTRALMAVRLSAPAPHQLCDQITFAQFRFLPFLRMKVSKQTKEREVMEGKSKAMWVQSASQSHKISSWGKLGTILPLISKINRFSHFRYYSNICGFKKKKIQKSTCSWAIRSTVSL